MTIIIKAELKDNKVEKHIKEIGTNNNVGMFLANEVYRIMIPYTPMDTGIMYQSAIIEPHKITYTQPYSAKLYYGEELNFSKEKHPNATDHWDIPAKNARGAEVARAVNRYLNRSGQ